MDRPGAVAELRAAVAAFAKEYLATADRWCVALSGGPDSLALTGVAAALLPTTALIVDHGLQAGSAAVAATAQRQAMDLGCVDAQVLCVQVGGDGGPEGAARSARYRALQAARRDRPVVLAHTLDDQAETVLLGLGRGSGARSIAGMRPYDPPWCRPLLGVRRSVTHAACAELGLIAWHDPHNTDRRFTRTRLRHEVLPLMDEVLGGGVAEALARTATALREDTELVDSLIAQAMTTCATGSAGEGLDVRALTALPDRVRRGVIRSWLLAGGAMRLTDKQIRGVDALVTAWRGQGGVAVGSTLRNQRLFAGRSGGVLTLRREPI
jgi:tRNA(Ile)-lysidine synthase